MNPSEQHPSERIAVAYSHPCLLFGDLQRVELEAGRLHAAAKIEIPSIVDQIGSLTREIHMGCGILSLTEFDECITRMRRLRDALLPSPEMDGDILPLMRQLQRDLRVRTTGIMEYKKILER